MIAANDNNSLNYVSVCSGIEAATAAWHSLGWRAVAYSEIDKFPSAVLAHHYPDVPNLGDFTKIDTKKLGRVDILAGGTPCQAFSIAGLRQSLADARGNLSLEFVRLAHELADGNGLRNVAWENVVGVLSTKDNAFGCFLAGLVEADAPIEPPAKGKWPRHGMVSGPKGRAAWAVKDAQFFGVAQRRRRVLVVADFGNGADPAAVLFEPEGVFRYPPARGEAGQDVAGAAKGGSGGGFLGGTAEVAATLDASYGRLQGASGQDANHGHSQLVAVGVHGDISHTLKAEGADASEDGTGRGTPIVCVHADAIGRTGDALTPSLDAAGVARIRPPGIGVIDDGTSYNLMSSGQPHAICFTAKDYGADASYDIAPTIRSGNHNESHPNGGVMPAVAFAQNPRDEIRLQGGDGQIVGSLAAQPGMKQTTYAATSAVRRLTPMECERLQGFPDGYTRIPLRAYAKRSITKNRPEDMWEHIDGQWWIMSADGPRYKALGNSWAVPKFAWLGKRIQMLMPANDNVSARSPDAAGRPND